jgi:hypothetical protein
LPLVVPHACRAMIPAKLADVGRRGLAISFNFCIFGCKYIVVFFTVISPTSRGQRVTRLRVELELVKIHHLLGVPGVLGLIKNTG